MGASPPAPSCCAHSGLVTDPPPPPANGSRKRPAANEAGDNPVAHDGTQESELHALRADYRVAIDETEANREQLSRPEDPGLLAVLKRADRLFTQG